MDVVLGWVAAIALDILLAMVIVAVIYIVFYM
jgi:hypothetical protein